MRTNTLLKNWKFYENVIFENDIPHGGGNAKAVTVPHVWNKEDASQESCRLYTTQLTWSGTSEDRAFLSFDAVGGVARVWVNNIICRRTSRRLRLFPP